MNNPEESAGAGVVSNPGRSIGLVIRRISRCGVTTRAPVLATRRVLWRPRRVEIRPPDQGPKLARLPRVDCGLPVRGRA